MSLSLCPRFPVQRVSFPDITRRRYTKTRWRYTIARWRLSPMIPTLETNYYAYLN